MRSIQSTLFTLLFASTAAWADSAFNMTPGVSPISHDVYELHMIIFWICVAIGVVVFGAMFYAIFYHRKSRGRIAHDFHSNLWLEIGWSILPLLILILMAVPATKVLLNMNNNDPEALTVKITGYQWKWHYDYLEDNIRFFSNLSTPSDEMQNKAAKNPNYLREVDHPLVLPIHKKIRFLITSNDANHAWWVPDLGVKRDAIPGFINEGWTIIDKPGTYTGQCAELCGINHAFMPIVVIAKSEQDYKNWVAEQKGGAAQAEADTNKQWTLQALMAQGEKVYSRICAACHQPGGVGMPPTFPALKGSKIATGPMPGHVHIVMEGKPGTAMQAFKGQLNNVDLASVITYERNAWGNNTGTLIQPVQIKALREGKSMDEAMAMKPSGVAAPASSSTPPAGPVPTGKPTEEKTGSQPAPAQATQPAAAATPAAVPVSKEQSLKEAIARGEKVYTGTCIACHQAAGTGMPPTFPALKGSKVTTGPVKDHIHIVKNGKPGTAMQAFKDQLSEQDLADVITYERNAWGNNTGSLVTPQDIKDNP